MSTERDDDLMRRYRKASGEADERPAASARSSILAAAARQVDAKPADAKAPYRRARWPLAAAAAVMLSTLAVMLAIRTQDEMPTFNAPPEPSARQVPASPAAEPLPSQPNVQQQSDRPSESVDLLESKRAAAANKPAPNNRARASADAATPPPAPQPPSPAPAADATPPPSAPSATGAAAPPATTAPARSNERAEAKANTTAQSRPFAQSGADAKPNEAAPATAAPAAPAERSAEARRDAQGSMSGLADVDGSAAKWLEQIIRLRREGRHDEADAELKRFRERYPQVQVPPEALPATGAR